MPPKCCVTLFNDWHRANCSRAGVLEHEGKLYCKQHHPPTKEARKAACPHCQVMYSWGPCETAVMQGQKYCATHATQTIDRDELAELRKDKARLDKILSEGWDLGDVSRTREWVDKEIKNVR